MNNPTVHAPSSLEIIKSTISRWPALTITTSFSLLGLLFVLGAASAGWPGEVTSNCYEDYLVTADCFCERLRGDQPGDVWFTQPMNTVSNLWFVVAGLAIAFAADSRSLLPEEWWDTRTNPVTQDKFYSVSFALIACLLGIGSTCLHASFTAWGRHLDMTAMYLLTVFGSVYPFVKKNQISKEQAIWIFAFMSSCLIYWTTFVSTPKQARQLFTTLLLSQWGREVFVIDPESAKHNVQARRILFANIAMFATGVMVWKVSESAGPLCYPDSLWQGHSLWHFQSGLAIFGQYCYYVAEDYAPTPAKFFIENTPHPESISDSSSESGSVSS